VREEEWLACGDPEVLVECVPGAAGDRRLRLVGVGWVRSLPEFIDACYGVEVQSLDLYRRRGTRFPFEASDSSVRDDLGILGLMASLVWAVEVAERFADGEATEQELSAAHKEADLVAKHLSGHDESDGDLLLSTVARDVSRESALDAALAVRKALALVLHNQRQGQFFKEFGDGLRAGIYSLREVSNKVWELAQAAVPGVFPDDLRVGTAILRDVFGNPFHPLPMIDASWLSWEGGGIPRLARAIYDKRCFDQLPELADALERAGCDNTELLDHCRGSGPHVRGCWVLDALLGKL
jgi:hypothetical protein